LNVEGLLGAELPCVVDWLKGLTLLVGVPNVNGAPGAAAVGWKANPAVEGLASSGSGAFCPKENPVVGG
jgi:hypothetical protein